MSLIKNVATVGVWTALSRVLGMLREVLISHILGASLITDAFVIAFKFPNFFRRFFAEGAFSAAFVPQFSGKLATHGKEPALKMASNVMSAMALFLIGFVIVFEILMPYLIPVLAPGFTKNSERLQLAIDYTRLTFPYIFLISITALLGGILNSFERFWVNAAAPILLNITMITALFYGGTHLPGVGLSLSFSVVIAGVLQLLLLIYACHKQGCLPRLCWPHFSDDTKTILSKLGPGMLGAGVMQINMLIDLQLASLLPVGALSYLYYADRLYQLPMSIFGVAVGTALLPSLSKLWRNDEHQKALQTQSKALAFVLYMNIPAAIGLIVLCHPIIALLFGHGAFSNEDVAKTAPALAAYALGLPGYVAGKVFTTTFFAKADTKTPVKVGIFIIAINLILNLILMQWLSHVGLALATSLSAYIQTFWLAYLLYKRNAFEVNVKLFKFISITLCSSLVMGVLIYYLSPIGLKAITQFLNAISPRHIPSFITELCEVLCGILIGLGVYFATSYYTKTLSYLKNA